MRFGWELSLTPSGWPTDSYNDFREPMCIRCGLSATAWTRYCFMCREDQRNGRGYFHTPSRIRYERRPKSDEDREGAIMRSPGWWPSGASALSPEAYDKTMP